MKSCFLVLSLALLAACSKEHSTPSSSGTPVGSIPSSGSSSSGGTGGGQTNPDPHPGGLAFPTDFYLIPPSLPSGVTNADTLGTSLFNPSFVLGDQVLPLVQKHAVYLDTQGNRTRTRASFEPQKEPGTNPLIKVQAETPLAPDEWFWLVVETSESLAIKKAGTFSQPNYVFKFFTGSSPQILSVLYVKKATEALHIRFSEPVEAKTLAQGVRLFSGGKQVDGCLFWNGAQCVKSDSPGYNETVTFSLKPGTPPPYIMHVLPTVMGSGRSFGESLVGETKQADGTTVYEMDSWEEIAEGKLWSLPLGEVPSK